MIVQPPLVLVVDDQAGVRRLVQEVLRGIGYRVVTAANGQEAVTVAVAEAPYLALLDMKMPIMDGLETLRIWKETQPEMIVLMMTAIGDHDRVQEALNSGARAWIRKPFDVFKLQELVQEIIGREGKD